MHRTGPAISRERAAQLVAFLAAALSVTAAFAAPPHWLWSTAYAIPKHTTSEGSGYFSIVEGKNGRLYVGAAKYRHNAYLVEFDPKTKAMKVVVDAHKEIGTTATGFAAQAKFHTRNNVGESGRIYLGTKQGYPKDGEKLTDYPGGYPMVYDPATGKTRVYPIPVKHQGIISVTPDESRGVAYISTCSDERPIESTHFMVLDLKTGKYRDLLDCRHMYAFIVVDYLGRAYHPILGGDVARYDPRTKKLERLKQTIDGKPTTKDSLLADPKSHPINWEISPDRKTLFAIAMSGNQLYSYDLTQPGTTLRGRRRGKLIGDAQSTDCRAMCVAPDGTVWAGVAATFKGRGQLLHVVSYRPGDKAPRDHGPIAISNPKYTEFTDKAGKPLKYHHGVHRPDKNGPLLPRYVVMGICAAKDGTVYVTTLAPFTLHAVKVPRVAAVTTEYRHNSHADVIVSRLLQTDTLDGKGATPPLKLVSLFTDQVPKSDISRRLSKSHGFPIYKDVAGALTLGGSKLAVDGVLLVAEHGKYPASDTGQVQYPKRRLFGEVVDVFRKSGRVVPVFLDKHLSDNWQDAKWIYDTARRMKIPLMAGSSLPVLWRYPPADVRRGAKLKEIVAVSYHTLDAYGFHALEMVQCLAERRAGDETGVESVQCLTGKAVWDAGKRGVYDRKLLDAALSRLKERPVPKGKRIEDLAREPVLFVINYRDGLRANVLTLNGAVAEWAVAWKDAEDRVESTLFWTQEARPFQHFTYLLLGIEKMMHTGRPAWPVERTLLTSGMLDALLQSKKAGGTVLKTPQLAAVRYRSEWNWRQPPPPPPGRAIHGQ
jgi:sugar lactone lactonase YvrE